MSLFPSWLRPNNFHIFTIHKKENIKRLLSVDIKDHIIYRTTEEDYFDLEKFRISKSFVFSVNDLLECVEDLRLELIEKGWNIKLSFGNTAMFIYSTEDPPKNCW